jgi:hypothetical protein
MTTPLGSGTGQLAFARVNSGHKLRVMSVTFRRIATAYNGTFS